MPPMNDDQIQEEFDSFALHLKDPDAIGDFKRLREIVTNEIAKRQAALEEIGGLKSRHSNARLPHISSIVNQEVGWNNCLEICQVIARRFTGGE